MTKPVVLKGSSEDVSIDIDYAKQKANAIGSIMLAFMSEFNQSERVGIVGIFYNRLVVRDLKFKGNQAEMLHKQRKHIAKGKKPDLSKFPRGLKNFMIGTAVASKSWEQAIEATSSMDLLIAVNAVFAALWYKEKKSIKLIYNFTYEDIKMFQSCGKRGHAFHSLKIANILIAGIDANLKKIHGC